MLVRYRLPAIILLTLIALSARNASAAQASRPNFVIFMTDDQRFDAMSCAGNKILQTPNMDRLAAEGLRFTNMFVTNSLCAPSRATLLTGQYSHTHGVRDNKKRNIPATTPLLPELLRAEGYEVAFCGKSHVRGALRDRKWDYYFGYKGQGDYLKPVIAEGVDGQDLPREGYMDDVVTGKAIEWLEGRSSEKPFCLFVWFKAPHRSWQRARRHHDLFKNVAIPKPRSYDADLEGFPGKPQAFINADNRIGDFNDVRSLDGFVKDYYSTLVAVDENVGRVYDALKRVQQIDETAILYTSDNGFFHGEWRAFDKRFMHEPSIRVPLLIRYPKLIKPATTDDRMVLNIDIAPTVLDLAGVKIPDHMHGRSMVPLLSGDKNASWRDAWLYEYFEFPAVHSVRKHRGVRTDRWKYIHYFAEPQEFELYDLQADPDEMNNLYGKPEFANVVSRLQKRLVELRRESHDPDLKE